VSRPFAGFSTTTEQAVSVPVELFTQVLAEVQDLAELKVVLTVFRLVAAKRDVPRGKPRAVSWEELRHDEDLRAGLSILGSDQPPEQRLDRALERAVARGTLLHLVAQRGGHAESWYLVNTAANREWLERAEEEPAGRLEGTPLAQASAIRLERPNIFALYEQNIGVVTPLLAEELEEAGNSYPAEWIEEAFREAVAHNRRHWRYVQAILERWQREGRGEPAGRREQPIDFEKYTRGKYADLFGGGQPGPKHPREGESDESEQP